MFSAVLGIVMEGLVLGWKLPLPPVWRRVPGHTEHAGVFLGNGGSLAVVCSTDAVCSPSSGG